MAYILKNRNPKQETTEEWASRNLIEIIDSLKDQHPYVVRFYIPEGYNYYGTLGNKSADFKISVKTLGYDHIRVTRFSTYTDYAKFESTRFSLEGIYVIFTIKNNIF